MNGVIDLLGFPDLPLSDYYLYSQPFGGGFYRFTRRGLNSFPFSNAEVSSEDETTGFRSLTYLKAIDFFLNSWFDRITEFQDLVISDYTVMSNA